MNINELPLQPFGALLMPRAPGVRVDEVPVPRVMQCLGRNRLVVLRGFAPLERADELAAFCERLGTIIVWPFGKVLELVEHDDPADHVFSSGPMPLHWDGMYRREVPDLNVLQCVDAPVHLRGGRTLFTDTVRALSLATAEQRARWAGMTLTYRRNVEHYQSVTRAPLVCRSVEAGLDVLRYCAPASGPDTALINPVDIQVRGMDAGGQQQLHQELHALLHDARCQYAHAWRSGDLLIADNHALLHGREAYNGRGGRHLRRVSVLAGPSHLNPHLVSGG